MGAEMNPPSKTVRMYCPRCGCVIRAKRHKTDPKRASTVEYPCNDCRRPGDDIVYRDKRGNVITPMHAKRYRAAIKALMRPINAEAIYNSINFDKCPTPLKQK